MLIPILFAFYLVFNFLNLFCKFNFLSCLEMEGVAVVEMNAEKKLEMVLQKYLKDIPMNDKQMILEMILKVAVDYYEDEHELSADSIANCVNDDLVGLEMNYYISGDDCFDMLFDLGFINDDSGQPVGLSCTDDYLRSIGIDFGDVDV